MYQTTQEKQVVITHLLNSNNRFPNNQHLPLVIYPSFFDIYDEEGRYIIKETFENNGWKNSWYDGIYDYHHYHSNTHEVLGVAHGSARVHFGGSNGVIISIQQGDIVIIPAGVAHKCLVATADFKCVGAYPGGQPYDIKYGNAEERPYTDMNIAKVPMPKTDPAFGVSGPLFKYWKPLK